MTYVHPQLITAHAPTIGAMHPTRNRDRDLADAITLEQIRSQNRPREVKASQGGGGDLVPVKKTKQIPRFRLEAASDTRLGRMPQYNTQTVTELVPRGVGGGAPIRRVSSGSAPSTSTDSDYKVTGTSIFNRPDKESTWDGNRWIRKWLPGEKEAEALQRVGDVKNAQQREILDYQHQQAKERAEQSSLLATERNIKGALLKVPPKGTPPAVLAPFATDPGASGDQPELFNQLKEINPNLLNLRDGLNGEEQQKPFDNAMAMALKVISGAGTSMDADPMSPGAPSGSGKLGMMFDSLSTQRGRGAPAAQPTGADEIAGVYASGGSIFGGEDDGGDTALSWLRSPDAEIAAGGGDAVASEAYASSVGGMIDAFTHREDNYI